MTARALALFAFVALLLIGDHPASAQLSSRPLRIYAITFRGMTDV